MEISRHLTAEQLLATDVLTLRLQALGVTSEQLQQVRFSHNNSGLPFERWSFRWPADINFEAIGLLKAYCALKHLLLDEPPCSRERDDAYRLVAEALAAPIFELGMKTRGAQRARAKKPRGRVTDEGTTVAQLIERLVSRPGNGDKTAKELWPVLFSVLDELRLDPKEIIDHSGKPSYRYCDVNGRDRHLSLRRFQNLTSQARKKNSR